VRIRCALFACFLATSAFAADVQLGPITPLDKTVRRDGAPSVQQRMQMLWFGDKGIAVWIDSRGQYPPDMLFVSLVTHPSSIIYVSPMRADGSLENPTGKPLMEGRAFSIAAVDPAHIMMTVDQADDRMYRFPIDAQGNMLSAPVLDYNGAMISDGKTFLANYGQLYDADGRPLMHTLFSASNRTAAPGLYAGVRSGGVGLSTMLQTLTDDGTFTETKIGTMKNPASIAAGGNDRFLVVHLTGEGNTDGIDAWLIDRKATPLRLVSIYRGELRVLHPTIWDGTSYLVLFNASDPAKEPAVLHGRRVGANGDLIDNGPSAPMIAPWAYHLSWIRTSQGIVARWEDQTPLTYDIAGTTFASNDALIANAPVTLTPQVLAAPAQTQVRFAPGGALQIATWHEWSRTSRIMMSVGGRTFDVAESATSMLSDPVITRTLDQILVAWRAWHPYEYGNNNSADPIELFARRFSLDGTPIDAAPLKLGEIAQFYLPASEPIEAAFDGTSFVVIWPVVRGLKLTRILADGTVSPLPDIAAPNANSAPHAIASNGALRIVWSHTDTSTPSWSRIVTTLYDGTPFPAIPTLALVGPSISPTATAWDDKGNALVVWSDGHCVNGMLLDRSGNVVITPSPIACEEKQYQATVGWSGSEFVVAWAKQTAGGGVRAVRVDEMLHSLDGAPFDVATAAYEPSLVQNGSGVTIGYVAAGIDDVPRVFTRTLQRLGASTRGRAATH
jgi:hypothetical protein